MKHLLAMVCCALVPAAAQDAPEVRIRSAAWYPPNLTISADANLVELSATVRDRQEHPIGGLKAGDFELFDNKQPQEISFFEELRAGATPAAGATKPGEDSPPTTPSPRTIALFFDDAHADTLGLRKSAEAAEKLISNDLHVGDRVGIFTDSGTVSVEFSSDRDGLLAALARLYPRPLSGTHAESTCPTLNAWQAYAIIKHVDPRVEVEALADAAACNCPKPITMKCRSAQRIPVQNAAGMVWSLSEYKSTTSLDAMGIVMRHLAAEPGKRMLILMTPGFPAEKGMESQTSALMNQALRANIRIGTMKLWRGVPFDIARQEFLGQAAKATGGQFVDGYADPTASLRELVTEPKVSYLLGFSPGDPDGQTHTLKTRIRGNHGYNVEARTAYFAAKPAGETAQQRIDRVAAASDEMKDFPATLAAAAGSANDSREHRSGC